MNPASQDEYGIKTKDRSKRLDWILYPGTFILLLILAMNLNFPKGEIQKKGEFWSDKGGYYIYLPATFIYGYGIESYPDSIDYKLSRGFGLDTRREKVMTKYTYGVALLNMPFFLAAHLIASSTGGQADGFSPVYQKAAVVAGIFYLVLSLWILKMFLMFYFSRLVSYLLPFLVFLGTNLYNYAMDETLMSHLYSFFLLSFLLYIVKLYLTGGMKSLPLFAACSLILSLLILIRPTHVLLISLLIFWDIPSFSGLLPRIRHLLKPLHVMIFLVILLAVLFPQLLYWRFAWGKWFYYSYVGEGFTNWDHPMIIPFLFSPLNGWFIYTPFAILFITGLAMMIIQRKTNGIYISTLLALFIYLFSSWCMWFFGGSFGCRPMIDLYPLLVIPLGHLTETISARRNWFIRTVFLLLIAGFSYYSLRMTYYKRWNTSGVWAWDDFRDQLRYAGLIRYAKNSYHYIDDCENTGAKRYKVTTSLRRSGIQAGEIDEQADTTWLFSRRLGNILDKQVVRVEASLWISDHDSSLTGATWISRIDDDRQQELFRRRISLDSGKVPGKIWRQARMSFPVPSALNRNGNIHFYIVNENHSTVFFEDLSITFR